MVDLAECARPLGGKGGSPPSSRVGGGLASLFESLLQISLQNSCGWKLRLEIVEDWKLRFEVEICNGDWKWRLEVEIGIGDWKWRL